MGLQRSPLLLLLAQVNTLHTVFLCRQVPLPLLCVNHHCRANAYQGSDFCTIYVRRTSDPLAPGVDEDHHIERLSEEIRFVKFSSITWTHDSKGFFYQVRHAPGMFPRRNVMMVR